MQNSAEKKGSDISNRVPPNGKVQHHQGLGAFTAPAELLKHPPGKKKAWTGSLFKC